MTVILYVFGGVMGAYALYFAGLVIKYRDREQLGVAVLHLLLRAVAAVSAIWGAARPNSRNDAIWVVVGALAGDQVLKAIVRSRINHRDSLGT